MPKGELPTDSTIARIDRSSSSKSDVETKSDKESVSREIGSLGVWSLSSCKPGFGVDQLRDNSLETYWQSDGPQPHLVNIQFKKKMQIENVCIYADYKLDESYTPNRISIRVGNHFHDLQEVELMDLNEPNGWVMIPLKDKALARAFLVQIAIMSNHQNGRDTHIRQIKIHSPVTNAPISIVDLPFDYSSIDFKQHATIR